MGQAASEPSSPKESEKKRCKTNGTLGCRCEEKALLALQATGVHPPLPDPRYGLRRLFADRAFLTVQLITAQTHNLPLEHELYNRVLANQQDIGREIGALGTVGIEHGRHIADALKTHIVATHQMTVHAADNSSRTYDGSNGLIIEPDTSASGVRFTGAIRHVYECGDNLANVLSAALQLPAEALTVSIRIHCGHLVIIIANLNSCELPVNLYPYADYHNKKDLDYIKLQDAYANHLLMLAAVIYTAALLI